MSCWVVNASPLIYLAKLDRLDLLQRGADEVLVPPTVLRELSVKPDASSGKIDAARIKGEISSLTSEIERLRAAGFYVGEALINEVLRAAGE